MNTCPLPIDWLDLLEGTSSVATYAHLDQCGACQTIVDVLNGHPRPTDTLPPTTATSIARPIADTSSEASATKPGNIHWIADADRGIAVPVLVLDTYGESELDEHLYAEPVVNIVPLWSDIENATLGDLLLEPRTTTLNRAWRAIFRLQNDIPAAALGAAVGNLNPSGHALVKLAMGGTLAPTTTGTPLESPHDPRLAANTWIYAALESVQEAFVLHDDPTDESEAEPSDAKTVADIPPFDNFARTQDDERLTTDTWIEGLDQFLQGAETIKASLRVKTVRAKRSDFTLSAATNVGDEEFVAFGRLGEQLIEGQIWLDFVNDDLKFTPRAVSRNFQELLAVVYVTHREQPIVHHALLRQSEHWVLAHDEAVSEDDIEALEIYLK